MPSPLDNPEQPTPLETQDESAAGSSTTGDQPPQPLAIDFGEASCHPTETRTEPVQTMDIGEDNVIKLDALGPMIINSDGVGAARVPEDTISDLPGRRCPEYRIGMS